MMSDQGLLTIQMILFSILAVLSLLQILVTYKYEKEMKDIQRRREILKQERKQEDATLQKTEREKSS